MVFPRGSQEGLFLILYFLLRSLRYSEKYKRRRNTIELCYAPLNPLVIMGQVGLFAILGLSPPTPKQMWLLRKLYEGKNKSI